VALEEIVEAEMEQHQIEADKLIGKYRVIVLPNGEVKFEEK